jgi:DNA-binding transcriptional ArsR family regulator
VALPNRKSTDASIVRSATITIDAQPPESNALVRYPVRAGMLRALRDGRALTAAELASVVRVTASTAIGHLALMMESGWVRATKQGGRFYYSLTGAEIARMIESIVQSDPGLAATRSAPATGPRDAAVRAARTCYGHLAGRLGVAIADALVAGGHVKLTNASGVLTPTGVARFGDLGIDVVALGKGDRAARMLCRPCLDWSERRPHLAGTLGAALCAHGMQRRWIRRIEGTRAVAVMPEGRRVFEEAFGVRFPV